MGHVEPLEPDTESVFLGDIRPGASQLSMDTNMFRAPPVRTRRRPVTSC